jgi:NAD(P)H-dependent FMN reductase
MITIVSATNRPNSNTYKLAKSYAQLMEKQGSIPKLLSLEDLPREIAFGDVFGNRSQKFSEIVNEFIIPAQKFVIISPEYNGSFPGILKVFLDALDYNSNRNKKAALIGVSTGRAGNLLGMEHLTAVLHYMGIHVHPYKQPVSQILNLLDQNGTLKDENTIKVLEKQIELFLKW